MFRRLRRDLLADASLARRGSRGDVHAFRLYEGLWRYTSLYDLQSDRQRRSPSAPCVFAVITRRRSARPSTPFDRHRRRRHADALARRGAARAPDAHRGLPRRPGKRILIFGAGDAGELIVRDIKNSGHSRLPPGRIRGRRPGEGRASDPWRAGPRARARNCPTILTRHHPHEVLLAIPHAEPVAVRAISATSNRSRSRSRPCRHLRDMIDGKIALSADSQPVGRGSAVARADRARSRHPLKHLIGGRRVMVTGAGGSIGSELCRQIARLKPASLVMLERYENSLHAIRIELDDAQQPFGSAPGHRGRHRSRSGSTRSCASSRPEIVFHAAAHKHVPLMEENPCEAIKNNVRGTRLMAQAAERIRRRPLHPDLDRQSREPDQRDGRVEAARRVDRPGAGRRAAARPSAVVRFGNVLGSNGSVVPRFLEQIKKGGPVTITHPEIRRFFMLIPEAVQLVLHAAAQADGGATYVLEMGDQVKLIDMARDLIRLSGFVPDEEIAIEFVGLRPGEKLYEELVGAR